MFAIIIFIAVLIFLAVQTTAVQTYFGKKASEYLSEKLKTKVTVGSVDIEFLKSIVLKEVYIEDLHKDTLLYSELLKVKIDKLNFSKHQLLVDNIIALNTRIKYVKYAADEDFNIQFLLDAFDSGDTTKKSPKPIWDVKMDEITLIKSGFVYRNEHDTLITKGFNQFDMDITNINGKVSDLVIDHDTILAAIDKLSARDKSGFSFKKLTSYVRVNPFQTTLNELKVKTAYSELETDLIFKYKKYRDFRKFIHNVKIEAEFNKSTLSMVDVSYFAPNLKGMKEKLIVSGKISGKIDDLRGKKMDILLFGSTRFKGDFAFTGLPNIEETLIHLNIDNLSTSYNDLVRIPLPPFENNKYLKLSPNIAKLGKMNFKGTFTGLYNDFYAYGKFSSALGILSSDLSLRQDYETDNKSYKGKLTSQSFDFGTFFGIKNLGTATVDLDVDGSGLTEEDISAKLRGTISELIFNNYSYKNIKVEGNIAKQIFKGELEVKDENIDFDFNGKVDFTGEQPNLDFISTINKADLTALHFIKSNKKTNLATQVYINVTGNNIDNLVGRINFDNTVYTEDGKKYKMSIFNLVAGEQGTNRYLKLYSDFVEAEIKGSFKILELHKSAEYIIQKYLPAYFSSVKKSDYVIPHQNFEYKCLFKKTAPVTELFVPDLSISPQAQLSGVFNSYVNNFSLKGDANKLIIKGCEFNKWNVDAVSAPSSLVFFTSSKKLVISDSVWFDDFNIISNTNNDSVHLSLLWDNKTAKKNKGDVKAFLHFNSSKIIQFKILPSELTIMDSAWTINNDNLISMDSSDIKVSGLVFSHNDQFIAANGVISKNKNEQLKLTLNNFNLTNLNPITKKFDIELKGKAAGETVISDVYNNIVFLSDTQFDKLFINNNEIGNGTIKSIWDKSKEGVYLDGKFSLGIVPNILFAGHYYPKRENDNLDFEINMQALQMQIFEPFVKKYCSSFKGFFAGNLALKGSTKKPLLSGKIDINAKKITVDYLNTTYRFTHAIIVENNSFGLEEMIMYDINNNKAIVNGKVYHDNFKNFQLDFDINAQKFMCLNTSETDNQSFYGKAFVSGYINIFGFTDNILIEANVKTEKISSTDKNEIAILKSNTEQTKFYIPLSGTSEVNENNFIKFVKKDNLAKKSEEYKVKLGGLTLDFAIEITPDAELQLIFDQKVGDIIKATGKGNVKLKINSRGEFQMYGDYMINDGDYLFTLQNVINKHFDIESGSTIKWTGKPGDAEVNINAIYKPRASLSPFFAADEPNVDKKRHSIDLKLSMTDNLVSPVINFGIGLPQSIDARMKQEVMGYLSNEAELNRQVFSLLILNSFVTPYQLSSGTGGGGANALVAAEANSSELLSNQLSNMLSKISNDFDIGVNYRPGDEITKDELEVALSTQLFNDKLTIDGNVGVNGNNQNPNQSQNQNANNLVGDVSIDYKITDDGKLRVKAFNKANDNNQINAYGGYTQGVGVFYREEFDTIGELFRRYLNAVKKDKNKTNIQ